MKFRKLVGHCRRKKVAILVDRGKDHTKVHAEKERKRSTTVGV